MDDNPIYPPEPDQIETDPSQLTLLELGLIEEALTKALVDRWIMPQSLEDIQKKQQLIYSTIKKVTIQKAKYNNREPF